MRPLLPLLLLLSVAAAGPDESHRMRPDHAPTPYSADEIRKACADGRTDIFRIEKAGEKPWKHTLTFLKADRDGADVESANTAEDGKGMGTSKGRQLWVDFQTHASFPEADTKITEETIEVPAGKYECWLYTVQKREGDVATVRMWFAKKLPGPPVKMTSEQAGKVIFTMTLVEHKDGKKPEEEKVPPEKEKAGG